MGTLRQSKCIMSISIKGNHLVSSLIGLIQSKYYASGNQTNIRKISEKKCTQVY